MAGRPSDVWRDRVADDAARVARGDLDLEDAYASELWSDALISRTDAVLASFERSLVGIHPVSDSDISAAIEAVVRALNDVNRTSRAEGRTGYETGEREQLCDYINKTLAAAGVDVDAYAARRGATRDEITDDWREW